MPNTLTNIMDRLLAAGLIVLRERAIMPRLVNSDYSTEAKRKGATIDIPIPVAVGVSDIQPSHVPPAGVDTEPDMVQVPLNKWKGSDPFFLTDKDVAEIDARKHFIPGQIAEATRSLANQVNTDLMAEYKGIYGFAGTPGTTPFSSGVDDAVDSRKVLNDQRAPRDMRRGVLDSNAEAKALLREEFSSAEKTADGGAVKIEGEIGKKFGIQWYYDDAVVEHTAGGGSGYLVNGTPALGAKVLPVDTGTGTLLEGDIITIAGNTQTYVITTDHAGGAGNLAIEPGLAATPADNAAITLKASHVVNLAFHRDAFAFANRPLSSGAEFGETRNSRVMQDPVTGLILRLELLTGYKQRMWQFDILYGVKLVRRGLACRIAG